MIQKIRLTSNHERAIIANPIAAFLRIVFPSSNFLVSPPAVVIWKPAQRQSAKAISPRIPSTQLIKVLAEVIRPPH